MLAQFYSRLRGLFRGEPASRKEIVHLAVRIEATLGDVRHRLGESQVQMAVFEWLDGIDGAARYLLTIFQDATVPLSLEQKTEACQELAADLRVLESVVERYVGLPHTTRDRVLADGRTPRQIFHGQMKDLHIKFEALAARFFEMGSGQEVVAIGARGLELILESRMAEMLDQARQKRLPEPVMAVLVRIEAHVVRLKPAIAGQSLDRRAFYDIRTAILEDLPLSLAQYNRIDPEEAVRRIEADGLTAYQRLLTQLETVEYALALVEVQDSASAQLAVHGRFISAKYGGRDQVLPAVGEEKGAPREDFAQELALLRDRLEPLDLPRRALEAASAALHNLEQLATGKHHRILSAHSFVKSCVRDYLPDLLDSIEAMDPTFAREIMVRDNLTARQILARRVERMAELIAAALSAPASLETASASASASAAARMTAEFLPSAADYRRREMGAALDDRIQEVRQSEKLVRLPKNARVSADHVLSVLQKLIPLLVLQPVSDSVLHTLEEALSNWEESLSAYANLDPAVARERLLADGKTARQHVEERVELLAQHSARVPGLLVEENKLQASFGKLAQLMAWSFLP